MNAPMAVMAREVAARRELFVLAAAVAVIAATVPYLPGIEEADPLELRTVASLTASLALGWLLAMIFGATLIGRDLVDGRIGFFFARPLSAFSIWAGKAAAAMLMVWLCEAVVLLPSFLGGGIYHFLMGEGMVWIAVVGFLVMPLMLYLLAHAVGIMARARTAWLFLDLAGFVIFTVLAWLSVVPYLTMGARIALLVVGGSLAASLVFALAIGGAIGLAVGRVDLRRTHGALSLALWGTLALLCAAVVIYSGWLRDFGPSDFESVEVQTVAPDGRWVEAIGWAPRRLDVYRRCLVSTSDKRWLALPAQPRFHSRGVQLQYSSDGSTVLWLGSATGDEPRAVWWADLGRPDPSSRPTNLIVAQDSALVLSADGSRIAILEDGTVSIYELDDERMIKAVRLPHDLGPTAIFFPSPDSLRVFSRTTDTGHSLLMAEVDVASGEFSRTAEVDALAKLSWIGIDAAWERLVVWKRTEPGHVPVKDFYRATDGSFVRRANVPGFPRFLQDGRIVILNQVDDIARLIVEVFEGGERIVHELEGREGYWFLGEALPNEIALSRLADPLDRRQGLQVELLNVDTGKVRLIGAHLRRAFPWFQWNSGTSGVVFWYNSQPAASRLFIDQSGALVRWDPETGELVLVVGGTR
jgi:hypothetical protein